MRPTTHRDRSEYYGQRRWHARRLPLPQPGTEGRALVAEALANAPRQVRRALGQVEWMPRVLEDVDAVCRRADWRRNVGLLVRQLALHARWYAAEADEASDGMEMTTRPTWKRLQKLTGLSRRTVARILAWLRRRGWLAVVETGTTEQIRAGLLFPLADPHAGEGCRAAVYLLTVPVGEAPLSSLEEAPRPAPAPAQTEPQAPAGGISDQVSSLGTQVAPQPAFSHTPAMKSTYAGAREASAGARDSGEDQTDRTKDSSKKAGAGIFSPVPTGRWTQRERLRAAETARAADPALRRLSARAVRSLLTPWWAAGWTTRDVIHALNIGPDGTPWTIEYRLEELRDVAGWATWRLDRWRGADGVPLASVSQRQQARLLAERAADQARRETLAAADAPRVVASRGDEGTAAVRRARADLAELHARTGRAAEIDAERRRQAQQRQRLQRTLPPVQGPTLAEPDEAFAAELLREGVRRPAVVLGEASGAEFNRAAALARARAARQARTDR